MDELFSGVYEHKGNYYLLVGLCRMHDGGDEFVAYIPLRVEPEWVGTSRIALRPLANFKEEFNHVGMRLPRWK